MFGFSNFLEWSCSFRVQGRGMGAMSEQKIGDADMSMLASKMKRRGSGLGGFDRIDIGSGQNQRFGQGFIAIMRAAMERGRSIMFLIDVEARA